MRVARTIRESRVLRGRRPLASLPRWARLGWPAHPLRRIL